MSIGRVLGDPLVHFFIAGLLVYALLSQKAGQESVDTILVDTPVLLNYVQYRAKAFDEDYARQLLGQMSDSQLHDLIAQYTREEALYREARKLGLEQGDYVIRQRLVGKMEYLTSSDAQMADPTDEELVRYFNTSVADYAQAAAVTFAHVFLSKKNRSEAQLSNETTALVQELRTTSADPTTAAGRGERFLFHTNYVDRSYAAIAAEFGDLAAAAIFSNDAPQGQWFGPVRSDYGAHAVFLVSKTLGGAPALQTVRDQVVIDYQRAQRQKAQAALEDAIVDAYHVDLSPDLQRLSDR